MDEVFNKFLLLVPINSYKKSRIHLDVEHYDELQKSVIAFLNSIKIIFG